MATATVARPTCADVIPDPRELRRVITESVRELLQTARLEAQAGATDELSSSASSSAPRRPSSRAWRR
jgi:hypothetical protein